MALTLSQRKTVEMVLGLTHSIGVDNQDAKGRLLPARNKTQIVDFDSVDSGGCGDSESAERTNDNSPAL